MPESKQELQAQLETLRRTYIEHLPQRMEQLESLWSEVQQDPVHEAWHELHRLAHGLAGSGATFGCHAVSDAARALEVLLKPSLDASDWSDSPAARAQTTAALANLRTVIEATELPAAGTGVAESAALPQASQRRAGEPVYIIEDDPELSATLALQLGHFGYNVEQFNDLEAARTRLSQSRPAALVVDLMFPQNPLAGTELVAKLRTEYDGRLPVIFLSNRTDYAARLAAVRAGCEAYLTKPVDIGDLIDHLDTLTAQRPTEPFRILVVEDSESLAEYYALTLRQADMIARTCSDPAMILDVLVDFDPDLILMDMYMPGSTGIEVASVIRQQANYLSVPIVFLSSESDIGKQLLAMSHGGDDFLTKPIRPEHLIAAITSRALRHRMLRSFMRCDSLTGLLNHISFKERLADEVARARRHGHPLALAMLDIDQFKSINDTYGHAVGDSVIKSLARLLRQRLRRDDVIGRYGGEEFAVLLPETPGDAAEPLLEEIRRSFQDIEQQSKTQQFQASFSCGLAEFRPGVSDAMLLEQADAAMYEAKRSGRNRLVRAAAESA